MRCNNCGWDNAPGVSSCVKCGHQLIGNAGYNNNPYQGVNVPNYNQGGEAQPRPTVINAQVQQPAPRPTRIVNGPMNGPMNAPEQAPQLKSTVAQTPGNCPHCGYPVMGNFTSCPNCGASVSPASNPDPRPTTIQRPGQAEPMAAPMMSAPQTPHQAKPNASDLAEYGISETVKCDKCGTDVSIEFSFCPKCGERIHLPTVRAIRHKPVAPPKPHCYLTLIPEEDEQLDVARKDYEGPSVILTRENTEPNNRTITSKEQAELSCEDGKWFLQNKSELGSTYLEASRKLELQPGDIIVLGDRRFKFEAE